MTSKTHQFHRRLGKHRATPSSPSKEQSPGTSNVSRAAFHPLVVVITGVTRGLGRAMVDEFTRLGHVVLGCARTKDQIDELACKYPRNDFHTVDVACNAQVKEWAERVLAKHGPPDLIINNAGVITPRAFLWEVRDRDFAEQLDINVRGIVNVVRCFVPTMIARKRGVIINFSSRWGKRYEKEMAPYCASKWAVVALTRVLAQEVAPHSVTAVALNPGIVRTEMLQRYLGVNSTIDITAFPTPRDWAQIAVPFILRLRLNDTGKVLTVPITSGASQPRQRRQRK